MPEPSNGSKVIGGVLTLLALIGGMAAIISPMRQSIQTVKQELLRVEDRFNKYLTDHEHLDAHPTARERMAAVREKFTEVETQFDNLDERTLRIEQRARENLDKLDIKLQLEITQLEYEVRRLEKMMKEKSND